MTLVLDVLAAVLIMMGAGLCLGAAISIVRFPDVLGKLHAITKPQVLGMTVVCIGVALDVRTWWAISIAILTVAFQLMTAPVAANMVARGAYRSGLVPAKNLRMDHLAEDLDEQGHLRPTDGTN